MPRKQKRSTPKPRRGLLSRLVWKKRSGNGTFAPQKLYNMINLPWLFLWKVGVTGQNVWARAFQINSALNKGSIIPWRGYFVPIGWVRTIGAYQIEQSILSLTAWCKITIAGRGGKEIRLVIVGLVVTPVVWCAALLKNFWPLVRTLVLLLLAYLSLKHFQ